MSGATQTFRVRFGTHPTRVTAPAVAAQAERNITTGGNGTDATHAPTARQADDYAHPTARYLAMAHRMEQLIRDGTLADYAAAGRWLGVTPARANMLGHLVLLAPDIQAAILLGESRVSEHLLRPVCRMADWGEQGRAFKDAMEACSPRVPPSTAAPPS